MKTHTPLTISALLLAPFLGLAFVIFLPLIGFVMVLYLLGSKAIELVAAHTPTHVFKPTWMPAMAFLHRKVKTVHPSLNQPSDMWADDAEHKLNTGV